MAPLIGQQFIRVHSRDSRAVLVLLAARESRQLTRMVRSPLAAKVHGGSVRVLG